MKKDKIKKIIGPHPIVLLTQRLLAGPAIIAVTIAILFGLHMTQERSSLLHTTSILLAIPFILGVAVTFVGLFFGPIRTLKNMRSYMEVYGKLQSDSISADFYIPYKSFRGGDQFCIIDARQKKIFTQYNFRDGINLQNLDELSIERGEKKELLYLFFKAPECQRLTFYMRTHSEASNMLSEIINKKTAWC